MPKSIFNRTFKRTTVFRYFLCYKMMVKVLTLTNTKLLKKVQTITASSQLLHEIVVNGIDDLQKKVSDLRFDVNMQHLTMVEKNYLHWCIQGCS